MPCPTCNDEGQKHGCPICFKVGKPKKRRTVISDHTSEEEKQRIIAIRNREDPDVRYWRLRLEREAREAANKVKAEAKRQEKKEEIQELWDHANDETWLKDRHEYVVTVKTAIRKEGQFIEKGVEEK